MCPLDMSVDKKGFSRKSAKALKINGGDEEGRTPDLCIAKALTLLQSIIYRHFPLISTINLSQF
jgi:hypothetical protein